MSGPSVEVEGLTKRFGRRTVLEDVSFRLDGPGAAAYLGPNGAGKTTTLKLLVGLLVPTKGRALLNGHEAARDRRAALWDVGAVIETPEPYPTQSVFEALETVGQVRGLSTETIDSEVDRLAAELELPPLRRRCGALSKGQRQRVVLGAALLGDPRVLLLDEPTSGLDPAERVLVRRLLGRLRSDHLILMSSHQMVDVVEVCDEVLILSKGRMLRRGSVDEISAGTRTRQLDVEFAAPVPPAGLEALAPDVRSVETLSPRRFRLTFDGADATRARILQGCQAIGPVEQFYRSSLILEEAYLEAVASAVPAPSTGPGEVPIGSPR